MLGKPITAVAVDVTPSSARLSLEGNPPGIHLEGKKILGTPTKAGAYQLIIKADNLGSRNSKTISYRIAEKVVRPKFLQPDFNPDTNIRNFNNLNSGQTIRIPIVTEPRDARLVVRASGFSDEGGLSLSGRAITGKLSDNKASAKAKNKPYTVKFVIKAVSNNLTSEPLILNFLVN